MMMCHSKLFWRHNATLLLCYSCRICLMLKFHVVLLQCHFSATLTKTPLKQKSLKRSSRESWGPLSNKHSMTNPSSQMTRPSHSIHNEWPPSKWLQSKTTTQTRVMELHFCRWHAGLTKQAMSALQHLLKSKTGPAKSAVIGLCKCVCVCEKVTT